MQRKNKTQTAEKELRIQNKHIPMTVTKKTTKTGKQQQKPTSRDHSIVN